MQSIKCALTIEFKNARAEYSKSNCVIVRLLILTSLILLHECGIK